jgi:DNA primase
MIASRQGLHGRWNKAIAGLSPGKDSGVSTFEMLRERVDLAELAGRHTELKKSGRTLAGRCPFPNHQDSTPSFHVYPDGRFHCFGCRRHGDVVDLWAGVRGIEPGITAALDLAREYGVELPDRNPGGQREARERRDREKECMRQAGACHRALSRRPHVVEW